MTQTYRESAPPNSLVLSAARVPAKIRKTGTILTPVLSLPFGFLPPVNRSPGEAARAAAEVATESTFR
jgi:hypothetical protein